MKEVLFWVVGGVLAFWAYLFIATFVMKVILFFRDGEWPTE